MDRVKNAPNVPRSVPKLVCLRMAGRQYKAFVWLHFALKATVCTWVAFTASLSSVPCKCLCHVYLQVRGEVAERLKAAVC